MLELNKWFFVLLFNFLVLVYLLNIILFKPLLSLFRERERIVKDSLDTARSLADQKDTAMSSLQSEMTKAREDAKELYKSLKQEGLDIQKEYVDKAYEEALKMIEEAREGISAEAISAKGKLRSEVERYTDTIVEKLLIA